MTNLSAEWLPSITDIQDGREAYMHYVSGVSILNEPRSDFSIRLLGEGHDVDRDPLSVIMKAENLMYEGLARFVKSVNPHTNQGAKSGMEDRYELARPHILSIVQGVYVDTLLRDRLDRINPTLFAVQPSPLRDRAVYRYVCHSRRGKLSTVRLMDGMGIALELEGLLAGRTLSELQATKSAS